MAGPGEPPRPQDDDDLVGFSSPASLEAQASPPQPVETDDLFEPAASVTPEPASERGPEPAVMTPAFATPSRAEPEAAPVQAAAPVSASSIFEPSREFSTRKRGRNEDAPLPDGATGLFTTYALILFAVPTLGVSLLIALLFLRGRPAPDEAVARSHHDFQKRTVIAGVAAGAVGIVLIAAPFAVGVPVLFLLALGMLLRGAKGVLTLKDHHPIRHPRGWWI